MDELGLRLLPMVCAVLAAVGAFALVRALLLGILVDGRHGGEKLL